MRAYIVSQINEKPKLIEMDVPQPTEHQVLINIKASAFNHRDIWITKGLYPGIRLGAVMGADGVGIDGEGRKVVINPGLDWGNNQNCQSRQFRVLGVPDDGTFADYIMIDKKYVYPLPDHLDFVHGAAIPLAGVTAFRALVKKANVQSGDKVLISGIGGGVAMMAMQFALAMQCEVFVTSGSEEKIENAIRLGAKAGYNYKDDSWAKQFQSEHGGVDVIIDSACGTGFHHFVNIANPGGRIAFYGGTHGEISGLNPQKVFWKQLSIMGSTMGSDQDFRDMLAFVEQYKVQPIVSRIVDFDHFMDGFDFLAQGQQMGKVVMQHTL
ncbi:MAG: zinc-binding dehydrogenase [Saprospiraceae bacterium]|nr:MAG: Zn-dependent alcohol dehydrogenase [Bacteroidetes bacterium OLB9]MCO6463900.1 zinc-binding dehydrogenase [Saprospiraceae bacterium]MCZ2336982.1 zinc-binding dehydrogenase [Chitinophagales bacterium]